MPSKRTLSSTIVLAALTFGACAARTTTSDPTPKPAEDGPSAEDITFGEQLAQIRGHHLAAVALYGSGDTKGAATHTGHPVEELLTAVKSRVAGADDELALELEEALKRASQVIANDEDVSELERATDDTKDLVADAEEAVIDDPGEVTYRASVVAALLTTIGHEYEEAITDGKVGLLAEYQDAYAFLQIAEDVYGDIRENVADAGGEQASEIDDDLETLDEAIADLDPPSDPADPEVVERAAKHAGTELAETVDAVLPEQVSVEVTFASIDEKLDEVERLYEAGKTDDAAELAAEIYLEHYELVEAGVIEHAPDVNAELEPLLGSQLRAKIREGVPVSDIAEMIDRIDELLVKAEAALAGADEHS